MRRLFEYIVFIPFLIVALMIGLVETILGKSFGEEWYRDYVESNMNHGQGPRKR